jgi:hypothetical protein
VKVVSARAIPHTTSVTARKLVQDRIVLKGYHIAPRSETQFASWYYRNRPLPSDTLKLKKSIASFISQFPSAPLWSCRRRDVK